MKQARFWDFYNGAVRIKINAGETLHHSHGGATDEGYSWEAVSYSFDGETVICEYATQARDCDGRYDRSGVSVCRFDQLGAGYNDEELGARYPAWQEGVHSERDHSAEAMNY